MYYLPMEGWLGWDMKNAPGGGFVAIFADVIGKFFTDPECLSNIEAMFCHAAFRECQEVEDDMGSLWVPSLMCQSECEKHNAVWDTCLQSLERDPEVKLGFDTAVTELVRITPSPFLRTTHAHRKSQHFYL